MIHGDPERNVGLWRKATGLKPIKVGVEQSERYKRPAASGWHRKVLIYPEKHDRFDVYTSKIVYESPDGDLELTSKTDVFHYRKLIVHKFHWIIKLNEYYHVQ